VLQQSSVTALAAAAAAPATAATSDGQLTKAN